jgi:hypothetical protein
MGHPGNGLEDAGTVLNDICIPETTTTNQLPVRDWLPGRR